MNVIFVDLDKSLVNSVLNRVLFNSCSVINYDGNNEEFTKKLENLAIRSANHVVVYRNLEDGTPFFGTEYLYNPYKIKVVTAAKEIKLPGTDLTIKKLGMDANGNHIITLAEPNKRGFSIQTNGNLPKTHKMKGYSPKELSEEQLAIIAEEVKAYQEKINSYPTADFKDIEDRSKKTTTVKDMIKWLNNAVKEEATDNVYETPVYFHFEGDIYGISSITKSEDKQYLILHANEGGETKTVAKLLQMLNNQIKTEKIVANLGNELYKIEELDLTLDDRLDLNLATANTDDWSLVIEAIEGGMGVMEAIESIFGTDDEALNDQIFEDFIFAHPKYLQDEIEKTHGSSKITSKDISNLLLTLNSTVGPSIDKYPIGNKGLTNVVKDYEKMGLIEYDDKSQKWNKSKKAKASNFKAPVVYTEVLLKGKEPSFANKNFRAITYTLEVYELPTRDNVAGKDDTVCYKAEIKCDPGYPDHSGVKDILNKGRIDTPFVGVKTKEEAIKLAKEAFKKMYEIGEKVEASVYHPEDVAMEHILRAYIATKFNKNEIAKKHIDYAMDHFSNSNTNISREDIENMVKDGKELFHDKGEDELKEEPTKFEGLAEDIEIGKKVEANRSEAVHPMEKGNQEIKLHKIKDKHIDGLSKYGVTGILKHSLLHPTESELNKDQIASVRKALVEVGNRNMGNDRLREEGKEGIIAGSDIAEWATWLASDCMGETADYLSDTIGNRNAKDTYLFAFEKLEKCLMDFYRTEVNKSNYEDIYDYWSDIIYNKKAISSFLMPYKLCYSNSDISYEGQSLAKTHTKARFFVTEAGIDVYTGSSKLSYASEKDFLKQWRKNKTVSKNHLLGGKADGLDESMFDAEALKIGTKVEMEHTNDENIAKEIAMDHLSEDPKYYMKLMLVEAGAGAGVIIEIDDRFEVKFDAKEIIDSDSDEKEYKIVFEPVMVNVTFSSAYDSKSAKNGLIIKYYDLSSKESDLGGEIDLENNTMVVSRFEARDNDDRHTLVLSQGWSRVVYNKGDKFEGYDASTGLHFEAEFTDEGSYAWADLDSDDEDETVGNFEDNKIRIVLEDGDDADIITTNIESEFKLGNSTNKFSNSLVEDLFTCITNFVDEKSPFVVELKDNDIYIENELGRKEILKSVKALSGKCISKYDYSLTEETINLMGLKSEAKSNKAEFSFLFRNGKYEINSTEATIVINQEDFSKDWIVTHSSDEFFTIYLKGNNADEMSKKVELIGIMTGIVSDSSFNVYTDDKQVLSDIAELIGNDNIVEIA